MKNIIFCLLGVFAGSLITLGALMFLRYPEIENTWGGALPWLIWRFLISLMQILIFFMIFLGFSKIFQFTFISTYTNYFVFSFSYVVFETLSLYYFISPWLEIKTIGAFLENISRITHTPFTTITELIIYPFLVFCLVVYVNNVFIVKLLTKK